MRIIYFHQYFNTPEMSGGTRSYEMARRLVAMGHQVTMITSWRENDGRSSWFSTEEAGINVHWLPVPYSNHMNYGRRIKAFFRFAWSAARKAVDLQADVVFASSTPLTIAIPAVYAARKLSIPMVFEVRDLWPDLPIAIGALRNPLLQWAAHRLERFAYRNSAAIVALSPGIRDGVLAAGYNPKQLSVIPNCSDLELFSCGEPEREASRQAYGIASNAVLVVYTGTFGKINGVEYLVRLAKASSNEEKVRFLAIGDGQEFDSIKQLAEDLGCLGVNFQLLRQLPKSEIPRIMAAADIATSIVIPLKELEANSANKVFDALAAGRCVAVNHGGWLAETLESADAGFQLSTSVEEAALQIKQWADNPERIRRAGINARQLAEDRFSRDKLANQLATVLQSVVEKSNPVG